MTLKYEPKQSSLIPEDIFQTRMTGYENLGEVYDEYTKDFREKMTLEYTLNWKDPETGKYAVKKVTYNSVLTPKSKLFGHVCGIFGRPLNPGEEVDFEKLAKLRPRCRVSMKHRVDPKNNLTYSNIHDVFPGEDAAKAIAVAISTEEEADEEQPTPPPERAERMTQEIKQRTAKKKVEYEPKKAASVSAEPLFPDAEEEVEEKQSTKTKNNGKVKVEGSVDSTKIDDDDIPVPF